jgi:hypothetical protein
MRIIQTSAHCMNNTEAYKKHHKAEKRKTRMKEMRSRRVCSLFYQEMIKKKDFLSSFTTPLLEFVMIDSITLLDR